MDLIGEEDPDSEDEDYLDDWNGETEPWDSLDTVLGRLANQVSKVEGKLTLELNVRRAGSESLKFDRFLSQFLEYGELDVRSTQIYIRCRMKVSLHPLFLFVSKNFPVTAPLKGPGRQLRENWEFPPKLGHLRTPNWINVCILWIGFYPQRAPHGNHLS